MADMHLLPCPYCGGKPESQPWHGGAPTKVMICCSNNEYNDESGGCSVGPMVTGETPEEAARRWNRRSPSQDAETIKALTEERDDLRERLMVFQHNDDADAYCADRTRQWAKEILNTNCAFVDDDLRLLAHLANRAVKSNLTDELPETVRAALAGSAS